MEIREVNVMDIRTETCLPGTKFVESIKEVGIRVPIMINKNGHGYEVIDGRRRIQAARNIGLETVPAIIMGEGENDSDLLGVMLNLQRSPNLAYEVDKIRLCIKSGYTQQEIADRLCLSRTQLKKHFRLLNLCKEAFNKVKSGEVNASTAFELSRLPKEAQKELVLSGEITKEAVHQRKVKHNLSSLISLISVDTERDPLVLEFESFVAKISTGRDLSEEVLRAIDVLRLFLKKTVKEDVTHDKRLWKAS